MSESRLTDPTFLTVAEVVAGSGLNDQTVRDHIARGWLKAQQIGGPRGRIRVAVADYYAWLNHSPVRSTEPPLEEQDWATPAEWADPNQDLTLCDPGTLYIQVHISRLSEFTDAKQRAGR